jgi:hypothetical protein
MDYVLVSFRQTFWLGRRVIFISLGLLGWLGCFNDLFSFLLGLKLMTLLSILFLWGKKVLFEQEIIGGWLVGGLCSVLVENECRTYYFC